MIDLTASEKAARKIAVIEELANRAIKCGADEQGFDPYEIRWLCSTLRDLERERDEAFNLLTSTIAPMSAYPSDCRNSQEVHRRCERIKEFLSTIRATATENTK